jgi:hypothetical protein
VKDFSPEEVIKWFGVLSSRIDAEREYSATLVRSNRKMRHALTSIGDGCGCDEDAHKYGTWCFRCEAREVLREVDRDEETGVKIGE